LKTTWLLFEAYFNSGAYSGRFFLISAGIAIVLTG
jgi:hypothetical protein